MKWRMYAQALWIIALLLAFSAVFVDQNGMFLIGIIVCVVGSTIFYIKSKNK